MLLAPSQAFSFLFYSADTGGLVNADFAPSVSMFIDGEQSSEVLDVSNVSTGVYQVSGTIPDTAEVGSIIELLASFAVLGGEQVRVLPTIQVTEALNKLDVGAPSDPVTVVPGVPSSPSMCRVYGRILSMSGHPVESASISILLLPEEDYASTSGYAVNRSAIEISTNKDGRIVDNDGNLFVDLIKTTEILPATVAWKYKFTCDTLGLDVEIVLEDNLLDFATIGR